MGNVKVIDLAKEGKLLPPPPDCCQACAVKHDAAQPHNQQSLHWQYGFYQQHGRWPTWADAMSHCTETVKAHWCIELRRMGVEVGEVPA